MFTGIVEELGEVLELQSRTDSALLRVKGPRVCADVATGDSIAVNGCCLTVVSFTDEEFTADVMQETLAKTALGALRAGSRVNLERAVRPSTRLGGHIVQGHVDATGQLLARTPSEHWEVVEVSVPPHLARYVVDKGSIAVDGVSLTVVAVGANSFTVSLIPETSARTTLGIKQVGEKVNLEVDIIAKYVEKLVNNNE